MSGHSALLFLETAPHAKLVSFDLGDSPWSRPMATLLKAVYGKRFEVIWGLSNNTVRRCETAGPPYSLPFLQV